MTTTKPEARVIDAQTEPRRIKPGCLHMLGCGCDPPYWLRPPTPREEARWYVPVSSRSNVTKEISDESR